MIDLEDCKGGTILRLDNGCLAIYCRRVVDLIEAPHILITEDGVQVRVNTDGTAHARGKCTANVVKIENTTLATLAGK